MAENDVNIQPTKINPIEIKGGIAFSAEHSRIWAEGTDEEVEKLGGEHSAKTWSEISTAVSKEYVDEKMAEAVTIGNQTAQNALNSAKQYTDEEVASEATARDNAIADEADLRAEADADLQDQIDAIDISGIEALIPSQASAENQLADKAFVNSSIATATANFIGTFGSVTELRAYSGTVTNNDYAFVSNRVVTDNGADWASFASLDLYDKTLLTNFDYAWVVNGTNFDLYRFDILTQAWIVRATSIAKESVSLNSAYNRYKATETGSAVSWTWEYTLNNSSFTAEQWAAIQSGITSADVAQISTNATNIASLQAGKQDVLTAGTGIDITNNVISATQAAAAAWGSISGTLSDQTDLQTALNSKLENTATGTHSLTLLGTAATSTYAVNIGESSTTNSRAVSLGYGADAAGQESVAIGRNSYAGESNKSYATAIGSSTTASGERSVAIGYGANAGGTRAIMLGSGTNNTSNTFAVGLNSTTYRLLESTGKIPVDRLTAMGGATSSAAGTVGAVPAPAAGDEGKFLKGDGTWADVNTVYADTDLSNLSATGEEKFDGSWTAANIVLNDSEVSVAAQGSVSFDISSNFESGKVYELVLSLYAKTGSTSGDNVDFRVSSNLMTTPAMVCANLTRTSSVVVSTGSVLLPYNGGSITISSGANQASTLGRSRITAYRRVK